MMCFGLLPGYTRTLKAWPVRAIALLYTIQYYEYMNMLFGLVMIAVFAVCIIYPIVPALLLLLVTAWALVIR